MKIETKYDVDDKVWIVEKSYSENKYYAKSAIVWMLNIDVYVKEKANIGYCLRGYNAGCFYDTKLFSTEAECHAECVRLNEILEREERGE